jgi:hypothetical protein
MRIGIDFDDTLSDWGTMLTSEASRRWGLDLPALHREGARPEERVGEEPWRRLILDLLETELSLALPVKPGAAEVTRVLAERHELVILTARHEHEATFVQPWLRSHDLPIERVVATSRAPKDAFALDLGLRVHFDDTARVFDSFEDHPCASALLVGSVFDRGEEPGAHVRSVESWRHFADLVRHLEQAGS